MEDKQTVGQPVSNIYSWRQALQRDMLAGRQADLISFPRRQAGIARDRHKYILWKPGRQRDRQTSLDPLEDRPPSGSDRRK